MKMSLLWKCQTREIIGWKEERKWDRNLEERMNDRWSGQYDIMLGSNNVMLERFFEIEKSFSSIRKKERECERTIVGL